VTPLRKAALCLYHQHISIDYLNPQGRHVLVAWKSPFELITNIKTCVEPPENLNVNLSRHIMDEDMGFDSAAGAVPHQQQFNNTPMAGGNGLEQGRKMLSVINLYRSLGLMRIRWVQRSGICPGLYGESRQLHLVRNQEHRANLCPYI
jgi:hypothetical protein